MMTVGIVLIHHLKFKEYIYIRFNFTNRNLCKKTLTFKQSKNFLHHT